MTEPTPPQDQTDPVTGPVHTPAPTYQEPPRYDPPPPVSQPVYIERSSRLNKVAAWVGIVAGSLFIVVVIFGAGFLTGKAMGGGHRGDHQRGHDMMMRPGAAMFPVGPPEGFQRGPAFPGPFGPGGPVIEIPRAPAGGTPGTDAPAPSRP
jgi:hypothetical protein